MKLFLVILCLIVIGGLYIAGPLFSFAWVIASRGMAFVALAVLIGYLVGRLK